MVADVIVDRVTVAMADELGREARDAVMLWLTGANQLVTKPTRIDVGSSIIRQSVYEQAALLGLVTCAHCGDVGCRWCARAGLGSSL